MKTAGKKWMLAGAVLAGCSLLVTVAAVFAFSKLKGDAEVLQDIDRHFESYAGHERLEFPPDPIPPETQDRAIQSERATPYDDTMEKATAGKKKCVRRRGRQKFRQSRKTRGKNNGKSIVLTHGWKAIRSVGPGTFEIGHSLAAAARKNPRQFIPGVRATIAEKNGRPTGFRLTGVRQESVLSALGFRNGDVLIAVNGFALKTVDEALLAAGAAKFADRFRVDVLRNGAHRSFYYRIVPLNE
jgi:hypothetical protein